MRRSGQRFIQEIKREEKALEKCIKYLEQGKCLPDTIDASEFGINNLDIEVEQMVKESGGFVPVLSEELKESPFSHEQAVRSLAKLSFLGYVRVPETATGLKITITSKGLDTLELPRITFSTKIPEDIALMLGYAHALYRNNEFETAIGKCYNLLERALKVHLIPSIDDCQRKWDETHENKWKGSKTKIALDALITFYKENSKIDKESYKFIVVSVKYISEIRSRYSHDKPRPKRKNDAIRVLNLTEIVLGLLFEDMKKRIDILSK